MDSKFVMGAAALASLAGLACAQPTVDGVYDDAGESAFYGPVRWSNTNPTTFGDNAAGISQGGGDAGNPGEVATGTELMIPKSALNNATSFKITGWINSADRTFISNQIIGSLPTDTPNIGNAPDWAGDTRFPGDQFVTVSSIPSGSVTVDGTLDAAYTTAYFVQGNFTGFGDSTDGTVVGGGGSEIDAVYVAQDSSNFYIFIAGNTEANGNGLDLFLDTTSGGATELDSGSGSGAVVVDGQSGMIFDAGFTPDVVLSFDSVDDGGTRLPRAYYGVASGTNDFDVDLLGTISGYGVGEAPTGGDSGVPSVMFAVDNSNVEGVPGSPLGASPASPDANWAYGSEIDNVRATVSVEDGKLYLFIGGNMEVNFNKLVLFLDTREGGQGELRDDNVDISFNGLNRMGGTPDDTDDDFGVRFDAPFEADYWLDINNGLDGGTTLINYTDAAALHTNGKLRNLFGEVIDYGSYFGGSLEDNTGVPVADPLEVMDFSGPRIDGQDGTVENLYSEFAPVAASASLQVSANPLEPDPAELGQIMVAIDNSNVLGVTDTTADASASAAVSTGMEIVLDLDEIGWDGEQDILLAGWIANSGFDYVSNQVIGGLPDGTGNLEEVKNIDFNQIDGMQYLNLMAEVGPQPCNAADLAEPYGTLNIDDVLAFLNAFAAGDSAADLAPPTGTLNIDDVLMFLNTFAAGCP